MIGDYGSGSVGGMRIGRGNRIIIIIIIITRGTR
jgi:hypothetical protein